MSVFIAITGTDIDSYYCVNDLQCRVFVQKLAPMLEVIIALPLVPMLGRIMTSTGPNAGGYYYCNDWAYFTPFSSGFLAVKNTASSKGFWWFFAWIVWTNIFLWFMVYLNELYNLRGQHWGSAYIKYKRKLWEHCNTKLAPILGYKKPCYCISRSWWKKEEGGINTGDLWKMQAASLSF